MHGAVRAAGYFTTMSGGLFVHDTPGIESITRIATGKFRVSLGAHTEARKKLIEFGTLVGSSRNTFLFEPYSANHVGDIVKTTYEYFGDTATFDIYTLQRNGTPTDFNTNNFALIL
jgi:hypothetical protein